MAFLYPNLSTLEQDHRTHRYMPPKMQRRFASFCAWYMKEIMKVSITPLQIEFCDFLQFGHKDPSEPRMILAYRGFGKTSILKLFQVWWLEQYPWDQLLFVGNSDNAIKTCGGALLALIKKIPFFEGLRMDTNVLGSRKLSQTMFNVKGKNDIEGTSWNGITYGARELTGLRAGCIILDDMETAQEANSNAVLVAQQRMVNELWNVQADFKPWWCKICTGTLHSEYGIWTWMLSEFDIRCRIYPALYPDLKSDVKDYLAKVSPKIIKDLKKKPTLSGKPCDRLGEKALFNKPGGVTGQLFRFNFMLDNSSGEESAYPLRCSDLIVIDSPDPNKLPTNLVWSTLINCKVEYLECFGKGNDAFFHPKNREEEWEYHVPEMKVMYVDTAGAGRDEHVWVYASACKGKIYILDIGAYRSNQKEVRFSETVSACKKHDIRLMHVECNNNHSAVELMVSTAKTQEAPIFVKGVHTYYKKEKRILNSLSELLAQHKLVVSSNVIRKDQQLAKGDLSRQLFHQLSHARDQKDLGLRFDDRLDAMSGACGMLTKFVEYSSVPQEQSEIALYAKYQQRLIDGINGDLRRESDSVDSLDMLMNDSNRNSSYSLW